MWPGAFILRLTPETQDWLLDTRCRAVKSLHHDPAFWTRYKAAVPQSYLWGRYYWSSELQDKLRTWEYQTVAGNMVADLLVATNLCPYDALLGPNEYAPEWISDLEWLRVVAVEKEFAAAAHSIGKDYWALSMSVGNLPPDWVVAELAKDSNITGISLHLYGLEAPIKNMPFLERYRAFIDSCPLPILIGETGRDGWHENIGWQKQGVSDQQITDEMRWLTENLP